MLPQKPPLPTIETSYSLHILSRLRRWRTVIVVPYLTGSILHTGLLLVPVFAIIVAYCRNLHGFYTHKGRRLAGWRGE